MSETTAEAAAPVTVTITRENAREMFMNAVSNFRRIDKREIERESLQEILRNNDFQNFLATCVNEEAVIQTFKNVIFENDVEVLQAFQDIGMNVDVKDENGFCALCKASYTGNEECVRWLLDHDANVEIQDNDGSTPLMLACSFGRIAIVKMLLQKNANPNIQSQYGYTALMCASSNGHKEIVQLLLSYNANIDLKDYQGKSALDLTKNKEVKGMLLNHVNTSYVLK